MSQEFSEHPRKVYGMPTHRDKLDVDAAVRGIREREARNRKLLLAGARLGRESCVAQLNRMGLTLWWRPEGTVMDRRRG